MRNRGDDAFYLADLHDTWQYPAPNSYRFVRGDTPLRRLIPDNGDVAENLQRISDAKRMADWVIGHFVVQNDSILRVPLDNVARQGLDRWESTPLDFYDARTGREWMGEWLGKGQRPSSWRDVVAIVDFEGKALTEVRLQPIEFGFQRPRSQRGRPMLATKENAVEVLEGLKRLSLAFGTEIDVIDGIGTVRLT